MSLGVNTLALKRSEAKLGENRDWELMKELNETKTTPQNFITTAGEAAWKADDSDYGYDAAMKTGEEDFYARLAELKVIDYKQYVAFVNFHNKIIESMMRPLYQSLMKLYELRQVTKKDATKRAVHICKAVLDTLKDEFEDGLTSMKEMRKQQEHAPIQVVPQIVVPAKEK